MQGFPAASQTSSSRWAFLLQALPASAACSVSSRHVRSTKCGRVHGGSRVESEAGHMYPASLAAAQFFLSETLVLGVLFTLLSREHAALGSPQPTSPARCLSTPAACAQSSTPSGAASCPPSSSSRTTSTSASAPSPTTPTSRATSPPSACPRLLPPLVPRGVTYLRACVRVRPQDREREPGVHHLGPRHRSRQHHVGGVQQVRAGRECRLCAGRSTPSVVAARRARARPCPCQPPLAHPPRRCGR